MRPLLCLILLCSCKPAGTSSTDKNQTTDSTMMTGGPSDSTGTQTMDTVAPSGSLFSKPMPWTRDVSGLPKSAESDAIISTLAVWGVAHFQTDMGIDVQYAKAGTPMQNFEATDDFFEGDCDQVPFPVPVGGAVEANDTYECADDGDCHLIVVAGRKLYEMWRANIVGGTFYGGCAAVWDLDKAYTDTLRGKGCSSADAGGFPIAAMLATADEAATGNIEHALRFILPNNHIRRGIYVTPGTHSSNKTTGGANMPPYAVRFRLKASFNEASISGAGGKAIVRALKKYGMFLADGGNIPLTVANDRFSTHKWDELGFDSHTLNSITVNDFEVVEYANPTDWLADTDCHRNP